MDEAIVSSTLAVIAERGIEGFSVEEVASRASVAKATIYRRYSDRKELINSALATLNDDLPAINKKSSAINALIEMLEWVRTSRTSGADLLPRLFAQARSNPELFALCQTKVIEPRWERVHEALQMGIERGELRPDLDLEVACSMMVSPVLMFNMLQGAGDELGSRKDFVARLVNHAVVGIAAPRESPETVSDKRPRANRMTRRLRRVLASDS